MVTSTPDTPAADLGKLTVLAGVREFPDAHQVRQPGVAHPEGRASTTSTDAPVSTE